MHCRAKSVGPRDTKLAFDRVNHKILLSGLTDLGITATVWNPSKTELLFIPSTTTEDVGGLGRHMSWLPEGSFCSLAAYSGKSQSFRDRKLKDQGQPRTDRCLPSPPGPDSVPQSLVAKGLTPRPGK
ncbi:hypothetical protein NFI96_002880, partial [Prochilodus magdalenae]